jgi:hypothetical protein
MGYPASPSTRRPMSGPDLAASIAALALTVVFGAAAAFFGMFSLAFLDHCPRESCSAEDAFAAATLALSVVAFFLGGVGYAVAVGA